jgi:hypothetical protein
MFPYFLILQDVNYPVRESGRGSPVYHIHPSKFNLEAWKTFYDAMSRLHVSKDLEGSGHTLISGSISACR